MNDHEFLRVYDFVDRLRTPFLGVADVEDEASWRMVHYIMRSELEGYPVTMSKLALVSGLSHGTAIRRIQDMIGKGLVERRPSPDKPRSFTLHPTEELTTLAVNYAAETKALIAEILGGRGTEEHETNYYFGAPRRGNPVIPPINLLKSRITEGVELQFLLNDDNYFAAMRNMWSDFRNNLASARSFKLVHQNDLYREGLANGQRSVSAYDIIAIDMPWLGEFAGRGLVMPIGDMIRESGINPMDFHPSIWSTTTWQRVEYGVPIYCTIEVLACRSDLFDGAGLALPRTFEEVISAGRAFHNPSVERYGIAWNAARMPLASSFMFFLGCCGQTVLSIRRTPTGYSTENLDRQHMRPQIDSEAALTVLDYMHRLLEIAQPGALDAHWDDSCAVFLKGQSAMGYVWTMRAAQFEAEVRSAVKRRVSYVPQPSGPGGTNTSPIGGFLLCIPSNIDPKRLPLATEALAWMASREAMKEHVKNGFPVAPRFSVSADPEATGRSQLVRFVGNLGNRNLLRNWQRPPVPFYTDMERIIGEEIHDALSGGKSDRAALKDAQNRLDRIIDSTIGV
ncbi:extracellular solute-binding protein [Mesorhizobium sp. NZP2234]|uniref:extracellular solute-binding protein n=1 Tax=Mesorhizobium sp. NZP2234 TaxID=2483402 RepID=UPI0015577AA1|nr:extracellular solute-binding protein [Mesorhizobium sp. NZP2234]QKC89321.1 extracellular solute-binding protein [Mesorhizobium sp. NZP2234]